MQEFIKHLYEDRPKGNFIVIVDGADVLSNEEIESTTGRIFNIKATRGVAFLGRNARNVERGENLKLESFDDPVAEEYLSTLLENEVEWEVLLKAIDVAKGNPRALGILVNALKTGGPKSFQDILSGQLYEISDGIAVPKENIIEIVRPKLISSTDYLVEKLKKQPQHFYELSPRQFEELLAELLTDMGWDVELTKETRDGGKDILAYLNTELGRILCLVEAKRYRYDRKIGVGLVRSLYGL
ncbi:restriction endonuclease [Shewanella baltica]|uniref:restriction endonuclease n=1 Tax=Shewanella baltica TaxID=62322 RepID=UPI003984990D